MRLHLVALVLFSSCIASQAATQGSNATKTEASSSGCTYKIKQDDTLNNVAAIYRVDISTITALNPTVDAGHLLIGQEVNVPCGLEVCSQLVKSGDTFATLGSTFGVGASDIQALNPSIAAVQLRVGMELNVPCNPLPSDCIHTIAAGDTLAAIATNHSTDVDSILKLNSGVDASSLAVGQVIKLPCNVTAGNSTAGNTTTTSGAVGSCTFTITAGVTFAGVAQAWGVDVDTIQGLNPSVDPTKLQIKQVISVPCTAPKSCPYIIKTGDSLNSISNTTNTDLQTLLALNPGVKLVVGQTLWAACPCHHTVEQGDTVLTIAGEVNSTDTVILSLNGGLDPKALQIGQILIVPCTNGTRNSTSSRSSSTTNKGSTSNKTRRRLLY